MMLKDKLGIDDRDVVILTHLMKDPDVSQSDLAKTLKLSQPSINARVRKLKEKGVLEIVAGLDANKARVSMVRVDFTCSDADKLLASLQHCSFFVNGFQMSGTRNVSIYLIGEDLTKIEQIIKMYLRSDPRIDNIEVSVVVGTIKPFICSVDLAKEHSHPCSDPTSCEHCELHNS